MELMFHVPGRIFLAADSSKEAGNFLKQEGKSKVLFICDSNLMRLGLADAVAAAIRDAGVDMVIFDKVSGEPSYTLVEEAVGLGKREKVDAVVGMGGGSALDTAKCAMIAMANGNILDYADTFDAVPKKGVYLMLIPTTFGTGSEVTDGAVISIPESNRKVTIWGTNTGADLALVDPKLALGLPASITASTGMDALSHAIEAYTGVMSSPLSDMIALKAIEVILKWLPKCVTDGNHAGNRANMCFGATMAGIAFNNGGLNQGHELAHGLGAKFHIPHGTACALSLPLAIRANAAYMPERMKTLAQLFGIDITGCTGKEIEDALVKALVQLRKDLGVPGFEELGVTEDKLSLVGDAWDAEPKGNYPFSPDREYIMNFVRSMYEGGAI